MVRFNVSEYFNFLGSICYDLPAQKYLCLICRHQHLECVICVSTLGDAKFRWMQLYVWDQTGQVPLLVRNKAAEILFANVTAKDVFKCFFQDTKQSSLLGETSEPGLLKGVELVDAEQKQSMEGSVTRKKHNFYLIWRILIKVLLRQGKNSPFRFTVSVDSEKGVENGRFELVSVVMSHGLIQH